MSQSAAEWVAGAIMAIGLGIVSFILGLTFLPAGSKAYEDGTFVPWLLAWAMIWTTILAAVALAGFLVVNGRREEGRVRRG
ncbi:MAG: hypothetical protein EHM35_15315 [Planctomycetaceae bacterium]|jgi:hypothetical protein|nr:MAG: hypothetical protein EHM35_15315 [Planctomycetaceae bacterium]